MEFTLNKINPNGSVDVTFSNGSKQNISGLPVSDADALKNALVDYAKAYEDGLAVNAVSVADEAKSLEGKKVDVDAVLAEREAERIAAEAPVETPVETPVVEEVAPEVVEEPVAEIIPEPEPVVEPEVEPVVKETPEESDEIEISEVAPATEEVAN